MTSYTILKGRKKKTKMQDLNRATLTGFVTDSAEVKFKSRKGKSFLVVRSDRFSGTPDDIIVEIPNRLKGTFREWNWIKVSGRIRSKWVRTDHQEKKYTIFRIVRSVHAVSAKK